MSRSSAPRAATARRPLPFCLALLAVFSLAAPLPSARAVITPEGDVSPSNPSGWNVSTDGYIGNTAAGTLTVDGGSDLLSYNSFIGYGNTATGVVNVVGTGTTWTNRLLDVGCFGSGTLSITNGGSVSNSSYSYIGLGDTARGTVSVSGSGSTWSSTGSVYVGDSGSGTLSITNGGNVGCASTSQVGSGPNSKGMVTVDGIGSIWTISGLGVGEFGSGTLSITNGGTVTSSAHQCLIGQNAGSTGVVTVDGAGSTLADGLDLYVGYCGSGTLSITSGGSVSSRDGYIGDLSGSKGVVTVNGTGSTWTNTGNLVFGKYGGRGTLSIIGGGNVSSKNGGIYGSGSSVTVDGVGSTWNNNTILDVGSGDGGTLSITGGGVVSSSSGLIGSYTESRGVVVVSDTGSTWTNSSDLYVGGGTGTLSITNGGSVNNSNGYIGYPAGSRGSVSVDGSGSTWINRGCLIVGGSSSATLSITNGGSVSSGSATSYIGNGSIGVVTVDGSGSTWTNSGYLIVGGSGSGTLSITNGGSLTSVKGAYISGAYASRGLVAVDGAGSIWTNSGGLYVGYDSVASGTLSLNNGGRVGDTFAHIGFTLSSAGLVTVNGSGSTWTNSGDLYVGGTTSSNAGTGTVSITGGGAVAAKSVSLNSISLLAIDVGRGSSLTVGGGTGTITNRGIIRVLAGAGVPVDNSVKYLPISAGSWSGTYQAIGGKRDVGSRTFTASVVTSGTAGMALALDRVSIQRALIDDSVTGWEVGASFLAAASSSTMTFTATTMSSTTLDTLEGLLPTNESVLSGWTFATSNYAVTSSNPIYLSLKVDATDPSEELTIWRYVGSNWTKYAATDLTYDGAYASFTMTALGSYAVSGVAVPVPEPGTLALLTAGLLGLLTYARRKRKRALGDKHARRT